jgi:hypothetical protein
MKMKKKTIENGAEHIENGVEHVENGAEHIKNGVEHIENGAEHIENGVGYNEGVCWCDKGNSGYIGVVGGSSCGCGCICGGDFCYAGDGSMKIKKQIGGYLLNERMWYSYDFIYKSGFIRIFGDKTNMNENEKYNIFVTSRNHCKSNKFKIFFLEEDEDYEDWKMIFGRCSCKICNCNDDVNYSNYDNDNDDYDDNDYDVNDNDNDNYFNDVNDDVVDDDRWDLIIRSYAEDDAENAYLNQGHNYDNDYDYDDTAGRLEMKMINNFLK